MKPALIAAAAALVAFGAAPAWSETSAGSAWTVSVERAIDANLQYPSSAIPREPLAVEVTFTVDADGRLGEAVVIRGTRVLALDDAAVEAVRRTARVTPPPAVMVDRPIIYRATFEPARLQASR